MFWGGGGFVIAGGEKCGILRQTRRQGVLSIRAMSF